jgi:hypothetical protein
MHSSTAAVTAMQALSVVGGPIDSERIYIEMSRINSPTLALPRGAGEGKRKGTQTI